MSSTTIEVTFHAIIIGQVRISGATEEEAIAAIKTFDILGDKS